MRTDVGAPARGGPVRRAATVRRPLAPALPPMTDRPAAPLLPDVDTEGAPSDALVFRRYQWRSVLEQIPFSLAGQSAAALMWAWLMAAHIDGERWWAWVGLFVVANVPSLAFWLRFRGRAEAIEAQAAAMRRCLALFTAVIAARAAPWALAGVFAPHDPMLSIATMTVVCALLTGAQSTIGTHLPSMLVFSLLAVVPNAAMLLMQESRTAEMLGIGAGVYLLMVLSSSRKLNTLLRRTAATEASFAGLLAQLRRSNDAAQSARERAEEARRAAEQASLDKTRFLAAASHDLRQPVHAIGLFIGALREEIRDGRARWLLDRLERAMAGLDELFDRLLDISRLDAGTVQPTMSAVAVRPLLQRLESRFSREAEERGLALRVRAGDWTVRSDAALLEDMLGNLLSNAFRYTARGGVLLAARRRGGHVVLQVWDTGAGIAERDRELVFQEFVQLGDAPRDRNKGLGLGLAIVRRLAGVLGVRVALRSRVGRGSVFELHVPLATEADLPLAAPVEPLEREALQGLMVLVVDDEDDVLDGMKALLGGWGCFVLAARSADDAARQLAASERFPDVVITDHRLPPSQTSETVVATVEALMPAPVPVILISGEASSALEQQALARGWRYLHKPVNPQRLRSLLAEAARAPAGPAA